MLSSRTDDIQASSELRRAWEAHRQRLASFARVHLSGDLNNTVCGGYSPSLQLRVLDLIYERLAEPVLDVGCGRDAPLIRHLRERGVEAFGIDRIAPEGMASWPLIGSSSGTARTVGER